MLKPIITITTDIQIAYFNIENARSIQWCVLQACEKSKEPFIIKLLPTLESYLLEMRDVEEKLKSLYDLEHRNKTCEATIAMRTKRALYALDAGYWRDVAGRSPNNSVIANESDIQILSSLQGIDTLIRTSLRQLDLVLNAFVNKAA